VDRYETPKITLQRNDSKENTTCVLKLARVKKLTTLTVRRSLLQCEVRQQINIEAWQWKTTILIHFLTSRMSNTYCLYACPRPVELHDSAVTSIWCLCRSSSKHAYGIVPSSISSAVVTRISAAGIIAGGSVTARSASKVLASQGDQTPKTSTTSFLLPFYHPL